MRLLLHLPYARPAAPLSSALLPGRVGSYQPVIVADEYPESFWTVAISARLSNGSQINVRHRLWGEKCTTLAMAPWWIMMASTVYEVIEHTVIFPLKHARNRRKDYTPCSEGITGPSDFPAREGRYCSGPRSRQSGSVQARWLRGSCDRDSV